MNPTTSNGMLILGIETSCDDTAIAVIKAENEKFEVLSNVVSSQISQHAPYGGIVPVLAAREHEKNLPVVLDSALLASGYALSTVDLIAVTSGPGLIMSLVKGVNFAKRIALQHKKPIIGVNHMAGHIYSNWLSPAREFPISNFQFPILCLIVSGGHTELILMKNHGVYELIGRTVDDAAGEAFDKIARLLGLPFPGGPAIPKEANEFSISNFQFPIKLPRPMQYSKNFDFSFSGLKTAVLYMVRDLESVESEARPQENSPRPRLGESVRAEIAHEAQEAIVDVLIHKTKKAAEQYLPKSILLAGGVSANKLLRERLLATGHALKTPVFIPPMEY